MSIPFVYECYADKNVVVYLRSELHLPIDILGTHQHGQGEVINSIFSGEGPKLGMVDEDPDKSHHRKRDRMKILKDKTRIQLLELEGRYVLVVKPDIERAFVDDMNAHGLAPALGTNPVEIHSRLRLPGGPDHQTFVEDLRKLYASSARPGAPTSFLLELETSIRGLLASRSG